LPSGIPAITLAVIPAKAGICQQSILQRIPAFAGMTNMGIWNDELSWQLTTLAVRMRFTMTEVQWISAMPLFPGSLALAM
jgi:hypothetical protein